MNKHKKTLKDREKADHLGEPGLPPPLTRNRAPFPLAAGVVGGHREGQAFGHPAAEGRGADLVLRVGGDGPR